MMDIAYGRTEAQLCMAPFNTGGETVKA